MQCFIERDNEKPVKLGDIELTSVQQFKYLSSVMSDDGHVDVNIRSLMKSAWCKCRELVGILCNKNMLIKVYKTMIRPSIM